MSMRGVEGLTEARKALRAVENIRPDVMGAFQEALKSGDLRVIKSNTPFIPGNKKLSLTWCAPSLLNTKHAVGEYSYDEGNYETRVKVYAYWPVGFIEKASGASTARQVQAELKFLESAPGCLQFEHVAVLLKAREDELKVQNYLDQMVTLMRRVSSVNRSWEGYEHAPIPAMRKSLMSDYILGKPGGQTWANLVHFDCDEFDLMMKNRKG